MLHYRLFSRLHGNIFYNSLVFSALSQMYFPKGTDNLAAGLACPAVGMQELAGSSCAVLSTGQP